MCFSKLLLNLRHSIASVAVFFIVLALLLNRVKRYRINKKYYSGENPFSAYFIK